jgi:pimeloyl-ACP methyl ester carboxylesterase
MIASADPKVARRLAQAGFSEQTVTLPGGTTLAYGSGPKGGTPLLLIHGQTVSWEDYHLVLAKLAETYEVYAVDCPGHGGSAKDPALYTAARTGRDLTEFIEHVIGRPAVVSGHSSGGLLTAWLAAQSPSLVRGVVLEDPPFYSTEAGRLDDSFAGRGFAVMHGFLNQTAEPFYAAYVLDHAYMREVIGPDRWDKLIAAPARRFWRKHPGQTPHIPYYPASLNSIYAMNECLQDGTGEYDLRFGDAFHTRTWFEGFDLEAILTAINCPSVLLHTAPSRFTAPGYTDANGVLMAAMSAEDAERAHSLIPGNVYLDGFKSNHDIHVECPREFADVMTKFAADQA